MSGTAKMLRSRIVTHVEDGKAEDEEARELALVFSENENKRKIQEQKNAEKENKRKIQEQKDAPSTPALQKVTKDLISHSTPLVTSQKSQLLFTQNHDASNASEAHDDDEDEDETDDDDEDECAEAITKADDVIQQNIPHGAVNYAEIDKLYKDINNITQNGMENKSLTPDSKQPSAAPSEKSRIVKLERLVSESMKAVAAKDRQIAILESSVESLVGVCAQILERQQKENECISARIDSIASEITVPRQLNEKIDSITPKLDCIIAQMESGFEEIRANNNNNNNNNNGNNNGNNINNNNINNNNENGVPRPEEGQERDRAGFW